MTDLAALKAALAERAADFCQEHFPEGKFSRGRFHMGDVAGSPGRSLVVRCDGDRAGHWIDFATGERGNNLLELLRQHLGTEDFLESVKRAAAWIRGIDPNSSGRITVGKISPRDPARIRLPDCRDLEHGSARDCRLLAEMLGLSVEGVERARDDGVLSFCDQGENGRCWTVRDAAFVYGNGETSAYMTRPAPSRVRQDRRLDGKPFVFKNGNEAKGRTLGRPTFPVCCSPIRPNAILCEGSSDFLAAYHLIAVEDMAHFITPVAMLGASNGINEEVIPEFRRCRILAFPDYDRAGLRGCLRWELQLRDVAGEFSICDYGGLKRDDGLPIKDLRDFVRLGADDEGAIFLAASLLRSKFSAGRSQNERKICNL
jgi:hypothetical protein